MQQDVVSTVEMVNERVIGAARRLSEINLSTVEKLTERQIETAALCLEGGMKALELMVGGHDVQTLAGEQARLAKDLNEKLVAQASKTAEVLVEARTELTAWAEEGFELAQAGAAAMNPLEKAA